MRSAIIIGVTLAAALAASMGRAETVVVEIREFAFQPQRITIAPGTTVRWVNREKRQYHNVWFESLGEEEPPYLFPEEQYERTFATPGRYPYRCGPHPQMEGEVIVEESQ